MIAVVLIGLIVVCFGLVVLRGAPYVPTHRRQLRVAFDELYPLGPNDVVVDLGSGDGIVLLEALRRGAGAIGYELNPVLVLLSRWRTRRYRRAKTCLGDYTRLERLPAGVTVVYAFTTGHSIEAIGRKLRQWSRKNELYFISYGFQLRGETVLKQAGAMSLYRFLPPR